MTEKNIHSCQWCGSNKTLVKHHYPITLKEKGREIVLICSKCHKLYHHGILIDARFCKTEQAVHNKICSALRKCFPLLDKIENPKLIILNPIQTWQQILA